MIEINYLAVLVASIANLIIGALWYGPVLGKYWRSLMNFTPESMRAMKLTPLQAMVMGFIGALITNYVLAHFVALLNVTDMTMALQLGFWTWLGFYFTTLAGVFLWEGKSWKLWLFNAAQYLLTILIAVSILALWR